MKLLPFLYGKSLAISMMVCPHWFMRINSGLAEKCLPITRGFSAAFAGYLEVWDAVPKIQPLHTADGEGVRVDWIIVSKVLPNCANMINTIGYTFKYDRINDEVMEAYSLAAKGKISVTGGSSLEGGVGIPYLSSNRSSFRGRARDEAGSYSTRYPSVTPTGGLYGVILPPNPQRRVDTLKHRNYSVNYSFAACSNNRSRTLWLQRDMCRFHGDETGIAAVSPLGPVCAGDYVEVAVSIFNGTGCIDTESISWRSIAQQKRQPGETMEHGISGHHNPECCPLKEHHTEWFTADQFRLVTTERITRAESFAPRLELQETSYAGIDVAVRRCVYQAVEVGSVGPSAIRAWGIPCEIVHQNSPIVFPLTRNGLQHDRLRELQLRKGDTIVYYMVQGGSAT